MSGPLDRANAPYLLLTVLAAAAMVWTLATQDPFGGSGEAAVGGATTTTAAGGTGTTLPDGSGATFPDGPATNGPTTTLPATPLSSIAVETLVEGLAQPVFATAMPGREDVLLVVERGGRIKRVHPETGAVDSTLFLNVVDKTRANAGIEVGLLGLAFHPDFETNGRVFIYYTDLAFDAVVMEYRVNSSGVADPTSETLILKVDRLAEGEHRHNAGMLQFGPDGYLWIASGDNGEFSINPQDPSTLKGGILRIDVDTATPYTTPPDNPFPSGEEMWAIGLRNPWRFDIDPIDGLIYIGDVGQSTWEEINVVPLANEGYNFGWPQMEGERCWNPATGCQMEGMELPAVAYNHADGGHCSVTGGYVYRGLEMPELYGHYFFSDWCTGFIRSFRYENGEAGEVTDWGLADVGQITSFGEDHDGELLVTTYGGTLYRIVPVR
ncbi:MAG TPA: PQQ-dependent sugar dehydrogenase [Acidimicrobiia bacterium]|nr:PQQ-dependent sugar dehydrogenase [Acidimicrobiia bacterium]